jgi:hypothetical protein
MVKITGQRANDKVGKGQVSRAKDQEPRVIVHGPRGKGERGMGKGPEDEGSRAEGPRAKGQRASGPRAQR